MASTLTQQAQMIAKRLEAIPEAILRHLHPALVASAKATASVAIQLAPKDKGDLSASIEVTEPGQTTPAYAAGGGARTAAENQALVTVGNPDVRYGHIAEFGSKPRINGGIFEGTQHPGTAPQPFFLPAQRLTRLSNERRIKRAISKAIKMAAQGQAQ